jgi:hypothetical protein
MDLIVRGTSGTILIMAKSWLNVPYDGEYIAGEYQIVCERNQASEMSNANAQQMMRVAQVAYNDYAWEMVPAGGSFIVEGTKK